jgi:hypothetical protein
MAISTIKNIIKHSTINTSVRSGSVISLSLTVNSAKVIIGLDARQYVFFPYLSTAGNWFADVATVNNHEKIADGTEISCEVYYI